MKKRTFLIALFAAMCVLQAQAKWTMVPRYSSYISISEQGDITDARSSRTTLYKDDSLGMFRVALIHETLTRERIKYIHRTEMKMALSMLATSLSAFSTISSDWRQRYAGRLGAYVNGTLADIYSHNASAARRLGIETWIENTGSEELMIADQERGKVWFLLPGQTIRFTLGNPDVALFRLSTTDNKRVHYVTVAAGSMLRDLQVEMETDYVFVFPLMESDGDGFYDKTGYVIFDKMTADQRNITPEEYKQFRKDNK